MALLIPCIHSTHVSSWAELGRAAPLHGTGQMQPRPHLQEGICLSYSRPSNQFIRIPSMDGK